MSLKAMYNEIAGRYATANRFGAISQSHAMAIQQIRQAFLGLTPHYRVLDLGVGDAGFLQKLVSHMPQAELTGVDISSEMLSRAKATLPKLKTIEASAADASHYLPHHCQDLVLAHFVNAYIPINTLFSQARLMTRANGHFSLITTTYESFPVAQRYLAEFIASGTLWSTVVGHYYKALVETTTVASDQTELLSAFKSHQFEVMKHQRLELPVFFKDIDELIHFGVEGTWFLNTMSIRMLPKHFLIQRLKRLLEKMFVFPYQDTHIIDVVLAKKL